MANIVAWHGRTLSDHIVQRDAAANWYPDYPAVMTIDPDVHVRRRRAQMSEASPELSILVLLDMEGIPDQIPRAPDVARQAAGLGGFGGSSAKIRRGLSTSIVSICRRVTPASSKRGRM